MDRIIKLTLTALSFSILAIGGCSSIGPRTMVADRFDYTASVSDSWKSQMLLNLVKIRYGDPPVFMDVGQIVAGYSFSRTVSANASYNVFNGGFPTPSSNTTIGTVGLSGAGTFNDSPTITYSPMSGERFARSLMTPIPPSVILSIIESGTPVEHVFRTMVQSVNGLDNRRVTQQYVRRANPEFYDLLPNLRRLQEAGDLGIRIQQMERESQLSIILRPQITAAEENALLNVTKMLGLDPAAREYRVKYGIVATNDKEIAMVTRSILEILKDLSSYITVPEVHVTEQRVRPTAGGELGPDGPLLPLIRIASSTARPAEAFVAVPYHDYWFSIDDRDIPSKNMFTTILYLFTYVETGSKEAAPVLTIPTTR